MNQLNNKRSRTDFDAEYRDYSDLALASIKREQKNPNENSLDNASYGISPRSDSSGSSYTLSNATSRWFGLLASDVSNANHSFASRQPLSRNPSVSPKVSDSTIPIDIPHASATHPRSGGPFSAAEKELHLMKHYVDHVSSWLDLTDPHRHFSTWVPHLAVHNEGLRKAMLALSARDLAIKPKYRSPHGQPDRSIAVEYYHQTLQHLQQSMKDPDFLRSDELLATIQIISTYELIDGAGQAWERHLKGAWGVQRSLEINGESGGFRQATWWAWLRQDLWAAFRERRKIFSFYRPTKLYSAMTEWDLAERMMYLCTQCVNFASEEEIQAGYTNQPLRSQKAEELESRLDEWTCHLTPHFQPLPLPDAPPEGPFKPIWIHPPAFGEFPFQCL